MHRARSNPRRRDELMPAGPRTSAFLICRSGTWLCALPLESVAETMRPQPIKVIADLPASVLGVAVIRAAMVPVVDISKLMGATAGTQPGRFVSLRLGTARQVALAVGEVIGVQDLDIESLKRIPPLLRDTAPDVIAAIALLDAELLWVLQTARLVPESLWSDIGAEVSPT